MCLFTYQGTFFIECTESYGKPFSFAQINCWTDTKLETVWKSLIVYNTFCACSNLREGARCV